MNLLIIVLIIVIIGALVQFYFQRKAIAKEFFTDKSFIHPDDADAFIVKGLISILLMLYNNKTASEIINVNAL